MIKIGSGYKEGLKRALSYYRAGKYEISNGNYTSYIHPKDITKKSNEMIKIKVTIPRTEGNKLVIHEENYSFSREDIEKLVEENNPKPKEKILIKL
jgi:hypothetical protein